MPWNPRARDFTAGGTSTRNGKVSPGASVGAFADRELRDMRIRHCAACQEAHPYGAHSEAWAEALEALATQLPRGHRVRNWARAHLDLYPDSRDRETER